MEICANCLNTKVEIGVYENRPCSVCVGCEREDGKPFFPSPIHPSFTVSQHDLIQDRGLPPVTRNDSTLKVKTMSKTVYTWAALATHLNELYHSGQLTPETPISACGLTGLSVELKEGHLVIDEPAE